MSGSSDFRGPAVVSHEVGETCRMCNKRLKVGENIIIFDNDGPWPVHTSCWDPRSSRYVEGYEQPSDPEWTCEVRTFLDVFRCTWIEWRKRRRSR